MSELKKVIGDYDRFIDELTTEVSEQGFDLDDFMALDHICYRVGSIERYKEKKDQLSVLARLMTETMVNGRPIATFDLNAPIIVGRWRVDAIELPAPKPGRDEIEGLEHGELVLYDSIKEFLGKYRGKGLDTKAADRGINPEIGYKLPSGKGVKFHISPLLAVVQLETILGVDEVNDGVSGISSSLE